ncbi:hypothetical protein B5F17_06110 [Butyricicoccus pullicaecorum]|uniref:HTH araC/xylS-type domain-containing protein n=1 Tax=Butyricicoccus pullicaecorum TaxID=501571 RepID=A0A1Y4L8T3_9FIRM|nr:AraC family transcriptional regulator [Butyricicoccus pullicaecorum]OUP53143.1 hypothetical protein B5F17_06110 [Butyricicoccus pullicaecorum]
MEYLPEFVNCVLIDRISNNRQSHLPHVHDNMLELFYVCDGEGQYMVDNRLYPIRKGDIVICNAGVLHGEEPALVRQIYSYSVALSGVQLDELPLNCLIDSHTCPVISCGQLAEQVEQIMRLLYLLSADIVHLRMVCNSLAYSMVLLTQALVGSRARQQTAAQVETPSVLAHRVRQYLDAHYSENLTLHMVADRLHMNEYYLAHIFSGEFGTPPMQYVIKRRIGEAQDLLIHETLPIAEVAERLGYTSVCHFNTMFKKYVGVSPGQYRRSFQKEEEKTAADDKQNRDDKKI